MVERFQGTVAVEAESGAGKVVVNGNDGDIKFYDISSKTASLSNSDGLKLFNDSGEQVAHLHRGGGLVLGGSGHKGDIYMYNSSGTMTVHISGEDGDVILSNADAAEDFYVDDAANITPGTVLVIDDGNRLRPSTSAYDRRVAGVVSGGSTYKPGIVLDRQEDMENRLPVALAGKVCVNADASGKPIRVGDLLTTSSYPGIAMCASDSARAFGAVIGKALAPLSKGRGSVPILVSLQ